MRSGTLAGLIVASVSTRARTWIWTFGGSYAIPCTIETFLTKYPDLESNQAGTDAEHWSALGKPYAIRYTIGTDFQGRRLDLHQHRAVYKTAAYVLSQRRFGEALVERGFQRKITNCNWYIGI